MTLVDFYQKVLEKLQAVAAGESPAAEDVQLVASKYGSVHAQLSGNLDGPLVSWTATEAIPDEAVEPLLIMLAFATATEFGADRAAFSDGAIGLPQPSLSERQLRQLHAHEYVSSVAESEYF